MAYTSQSGCSSGAYNTSSPGACSGGLCSSMISGYSAGHSISPAYPVLHSIDSVISSYAGPAASAMESALQAYQPAFFDVPGQNPLSSYGISDSINAAIYAGIGSGYRGEGQQQGPQPRPDNFNPNVFLNRDRPSSPFIGSSDDIKHYIKDAFEKTTGKKLLDDVMIRVVSQHELKELHEEFGGIWSPGIQGISLNKKGFSQSMIICKENDLDLLLVTIGHELGHVINFPLPDKLDEEAKAFAFEMAWIRKMHEHNIAGLKDSLNSDPCPARNGLHDVAFDFVKEQLRKGKDPFDIIKDLMHNRIKVKGDSNVWL